MDGKHLGEDGYVSRDQNDHVQEDGQNQQDEEQSIAVELLNIASIFGVFQTECEKSSNPNGLEQHYYVERPHVLVEE
jgi:hypothetical protein